MDEQESTTTTTITTITIVQQLDDKGDVVSETKTTVETTKPAPIHPGMYL